MSKRWCIPALMLAALTALGVAGPAGCGSAEAITSLGQLEEGVFAVPNGTIADELVLSRFPEAEFIYFPTVDKCVQAVKEGRADAAAYDDPILRSIAARTEGVTVLSDLITVDQYAFAVDRGDQGLKAEVDQVLQGLRDDGIYDEMLRRWLPEEGAPGAMPDIDLPDSGDPLIFGTAAVTKPFSFVDDDERLTGFDVELAARVAQALGRPLEVVPLDFGALITALGNNEVDMIGALITISEERAEEVLFTEPYLEGGIAALVRD